MDDSRKTNGLATDQEMLMILQEHCRQFDEHRVAWLQFREQTMRKVEHIEHTVREVAPHLMHLSELPSIAQGISATNSNLELLRHGLVSHNAQLLGQNQSLVNPATKAQTMLMNLAVLMVLFLGVTVSLVLVRETKKEVSIGGDRGLHITEPKAGGQSHS